jgi:hypothetical protein
MKSRILGCLVLLLFLSTVASAQTTDGLLEVFMVKVKPEKRSEFDAISKKIADANRKNGGDAWLATEVAYGEGNAVNFTSVRTNFADIDRGMEKFMGALGKAYGQAGVMKLFQDFSNCVVSSRTEIRRRRSELSSNMPDPAAFSKLLGESRWVRTLMVRVRPGRAGEYEAQIRTNKTAMEKSSQTPTFVSQAVAGQQGTVFYLTSLRSSLGGFDSAPSLQQALGADGYQKYQKVASDTVLNTETIIYRFLPELSNPPEEVASASPDFWKPKPPPKAKPVTDGSASNQPAKKQ